MVRMGRDVRALGVAPARSRRMSPEEYAEYMGVSRTTAYRMLAAGRIADAIKFGGQWRINPDSSVN